MNRPELIAAHGFDTKYAAHAVRLGMQGVEYLSTGRIQLPMRESDAAEIRVLRRGDMAEADALAWAEQLRDELAVAAE